MHTKRDKKKLLNRLSRIRGQVDAIQRALEQEDECSRVLNTIAACRGAMTGLMAEVLEGHIHTHVVQPENPADRNEGALDLVEVLRSYMK
jgi:DNA-binding FrmR family transcriptional regulator